MNPRRKFRFVRAAGALLFAIALVFSAVIPALIVTTGLPFRTSSSSRRLTFRGEDYTVILKNPKDAGIPSGATLSVSEVAPGSDAFSAYLERASARLGETGSFARFFDISIIDSDGRRIQPVSEVSITVKCDGMPDTVRVVHFPGEELPLPSESLSSAGSPASRTAVIPGGLRTSAAGMLTAIAIQNFAGAYRLASGTSADPQEDSADEEKALPVSSDLDMEIMDSDAGKGSVVFTSGSFSVYGIIEAPNPLVFDPYEITSVSAVEEGRGYLLSYGSPKNYFTSTLNGNGALIETTDASSAALWYFESTGGSNGFLIYTYTGTAPNTEKKYIKQNPDPQKLNEIMLAAEGTPFVLSKVNNTNSFQFKHATQNRWLQHSTSGNGIRLYTSKDNATNTRISITVPADSSSDDPYGLGGRTFGIAYNDDSSSAAALMASPVVVSGKNGLAATAMHIRPDVVSNSGILLVAENSDITMWTFESVEKDRYRLSAVSGSGTVWLKIDQNSVVLTDVPGDASVIKAVPGTGAYAGKYCFMTEDGQYILEMQNTSSGFLSVRRTTASTDRVWMNLVERTSLTDEDFVKYTARRISASDDILSGSGGEKAKVVLYTRFWNDSKKKYEYYAVDHNGSLIYVWSSGDLIEWIGNRVNSALWEFTEYTWGDGTPNYYYEMENVAYAGEYLAPQIGGIIQDHTVGINLDGRKEGMDYTTVVAWDDEAYAYIGLKVVEDASGARTVVTCPLDEAQDFYFAVLIPETGGGAAGGSSAGALSTVETIDSEAYGITMKMVDFNNTLYKDRDSVQHPFLGGFDSEHNTDATLGLLSTNLGADGYPVTTARTNNEGHSLSELYTGMTDANHLFIQSVYNESGYFEYDSTQNFAHFNENEGTFTVYDQLAAIGTATRATRTHGQFMPYNEISTAVGYAYDTSGNPITNLTDVLQNPLSDADPRKGENLYLIPQNSADYFFGMELEAVFTQSPSGLDDWGHDIIFEFTGDDDFWLYVDGELVLDLGGVRPALAGSVNFRTGTVINAGTVTTLYDVFRNNYIARGMSQQEIETRLDAIFEYKADVDAYVFRDHTSHTMKMFYMERGAGASNLKMRFNLASVKPGNVELSKVLSGTSDSTNELIDYLFQVWYTVDEIVYETDGNGNFLLDDFGAKIPLLDGNGEIVTVESAPRRLVQREDDGDPGVVWRGTHTLIPFRNSLTVNGFTYDDVFLLKAGKTAVIELPPGVHDYLIIECGVNTAAYESVSVNGTAVAGSVYANQDTPSASGNYQGTLRSDFGIDYATTEERPRVTFDNRVDQNALKTLSFTKKVYDEEGNPLTAAEMAGITSEFSFRLYLGNEYSGSGEPELADMYTYFVKDPDGNYCVWNIAQQGFVSLGTGDFSQLTNAQIREAARTTSMYGSISRIPAGYTVEVRDLLIDTKWKVEERLNEIPRGYTLRQLDGYARVDAGHETEQSDPIGGVIGENEDPQVEVRNQEGWGLTVNKVWTDADFASHGDIFIALYASRDGSDPVLVEGSVHRLREGETEIYFFFPDLKLNGATEPYAFADITVREVMVAVAGGTDLVVGDDGIVQIVPGITVTPIAGTVSDRILTVGAAPKTGGTAVDTDYTVVYQPGVLTGRNENIRTDTVINRRPGIEVYKNSYAGAPLYGAVFTLTDSAGNAPGSETYTSAADGSVMLAYLQAGEYLLTEIRSPSGYEGLESPILMTVTGTGASQTLSVTDADGNAYDAGMYILDNEPDSGMIARLTVKNRPVSLQVIKEDGATHEPLAGVKFDLYRQVTGSGGIPVKDYTPWTSGGVSYSDLTTDADGVLPLITMDLPGGTWYLTETETAEGYAGLTGDIVFSVGAVGNVTVLSDGHSGWLVRTVDASGAVSYVITVPNTEIKRLQFVKTDFNDTAGTRLRGARFDLYSTHTEEIEGVQVRVRDSEPLRTGLVSGGDGVLTDGSARVFELPLGVYWLIETEAPAGYMLRETPIEITLGSGSGAGAVSYDEGTSVSAGGGGISLSGGVYSLLLTNFPGIELPDTGGTGIIPFIIIGPALMLASGLLLAATRRRERRRAKKGIIVL